jgi:NADH-quinone oxidoreductase subunit L
VTVLLTAFYMFRLWYLTFFGASRAEPGHEHPHESPWVMLVPLILLAVLSVAGGWIGIPRALGGNDQFAHFLDPVLSPPSPPSYEQIRITMNEQGVARAAEASTPQAPARPAGNDNQERLFSVLSVVMALAGWFMADLLYRRKPAMAHQLAQRAGGAYGLLLHKYWIDQLYNALIVVPLLFLTRYLLWGAVDSGIINGGGSAAAGTVRGLGALVQRVQSGNIRSYAGWLAIGAAALLLLTYFGFSMHV